MNATKEGEMIHFGLASWEEMRIILEHWMPAREATLLARAFSTTLAMAKIGATAEDAWKQGADSIRCDAMAIAQHERRKQRGRSAAETTTSPSIQRNLQQDEGNEP